MTAALALGSASLLPVQADDGGPVASTISVEKVEGLAEDFALGVDVSSVLSLEESGVQFRDAAGEPADLFEVLADSGVTHVRVRVWNDPRDAEGNGYGGGTLDVARAVEIGERATAAGLAVLVDFHYSDFWADPAKQQVPKAWVGLDAAAVADAAGAFTRDALGEFLAAGVHVTMVQVGNETNSAVAGVTGWDGMAGVFSAGSAAVREVFPDALVAVHLTNPETAGRYADAAAALAERNVDYDVFASSYYPYWHGTLENLTSVLSHVAETYDKQVMVAETSWAYTLDDGDGHPNVIETDYPQYPASVQGQAWSVRDVVAAVAAVGDAGIGVFYWEPAWLPVGPPEQAEQNALLWEAHGSGWASSFAGDYDPEDAGQWYGGSAWDNQALFAHDGTPLESLQVFRYVRTGATAPREAVAVEHVTLTVAAGDPVPLPETVTVTYNDRSTDEQPVTWDAPAISGPGVYVIDGVTSAGLETAATVTVTAVNHLVNPGFEEGESGWTLSGTGVDVAWEDPLAGERALHWWADVDFSFTVTQHVHGLPSGDYLLSASAQGRPLTEGDELALVALTSDGEGRAMFPLSGWAEWQQVELPVTIGDDGEVAVAIAGTMTAEAWGTLDEVSLVAVGGGEPTPTPTPTPTDEPTATQPTSPGEPTSEPSTTDPTEATPSGAVITLGATRVAAGGLLDVVVSGLTGVNEIEVGIASTYTRLATAPATDGGAEVTVRIPADLTPGEHEIQVRADGDVLARAPIEVLAASAPGGLADTGVSTPAPALVVAGVLLAIGAGALALRRRALRHRLT
ncbi:glycosyl hydrolase 53 family protein [Pseudactinotalea sp.]|uniref:glycosyl hydrolase 53 family protein n=1 Tax=Pseudactinotalea sp. TaxID=1926260 RepID=UPI003B3AEEB4